MASSPPVLTAADLARFPRGDRRYELVRGRAIRMTPVGYLHGRTVVRLASLLDRHVHSRALGAVLTEVGFTLGTNPDTVRAPDIAFIRQDRIPVPAPRGFWSGAPDLAVEVLSPEDRTAEVDAKIQEYLDRGTRAVAIVDPERRSATVHRARTPPAAIAADGGSLDLSDVVPGFTCPLRELFD
jgi:Uma2 family endonuclease